MIAIGEASRLSGVAVETIRYYEREGFIAKAHRSPSGRRYYAHDGIAELRFIRRCRELGFSVRDAVTLRRLSREPDGACATVEALGRQHLSRVREKLADLRKLEAGLAELVSNCSAGRRDCPMLDALLRDGG